MLNMKPKQGHVAMGTTLTLLTLTHLKEQYMQTCECVGRTITCVSVKIVPIAIGRYSNNKQIYKRSFSRYNRESTVEACAKWRHKDIGVLWKQRTNRWTQPGIMNVSADKWAMLKEQRSWNVARPTYCRKQAMAWRRKLRDENGHSPQWDVDMAGHYWVFPPACHNGIGLICLWFLHSAWFQISAAKQMRTALFWDVTQRVVVTP
jgi:hypothetical protein